MTVLARGGLGCLRGLITDDFLVTLHDFSRSYERRSLSEFSVAIVGVSHDREDVEQAFPESEMNYGWVTTPEPHRARGVLTSSRKCVRG